MRCPYCNSKIEKLDNVVIEYTERQSRFGNIISTCPICRGFLTIDPNEAEKILNNIKSDEIYKVENSEKEEVFNQISNIITRLKIDKDLYAEILLDNLLGDQK